MQLRHILDKRYKENNTKNKTIAAFEELVTETECWEQNQVLCVGLLPKLPAANRLSHPSGVAAGHTLTLSPDKEQAQGVSQQGSLSRVLAPPFCSRGPRKAFGFLVCRLSIFID